MAATNAAKMAGDKYAAFCAAFLGGQELSQIAAEHGASLAALRKYADRHGWHEQRRKLSQKVIARAEANLQKKLEAVMENGVTLTIGVQNDVAATRAEKKAAREVFTPQENRAHMATALDSLKAFNLATGKPTASIELTGGLTLAQMDRAQVDAMMREVLQE